MPQSFSDTALATVAVAISAFVVCAAGYLWYLEPGRWRPFLAAIAVVGASWGFRQVANRHWRTDDVLRTKRRKFTQAIVVGTAMIAYPLGRLLFIYFGLLAP
jgi:hypothetical protein